MYYHTKITIGFNGMEFLYRLTILFPMFTSRLTFHPLGTYQKLQRQWVICSPCTTLAVLAQNSRLCLCLTAHVFHVDCDIVTACSLTATNDVWSFCCLIFFFLRVGKRNGSTILYCVQNLYTTTLMQAQCVAYHNVIFVGLHKGRYSLKTRFISPLTRKGLEININRLTWEHNGVCYSVRRQLRTM